jgi:hypothetical protein
LSHTLLQIQVLGLCTRLARFGFRLKSQFLPLPQNPSNSKNGQK